MMLLRRISSEEKGKGADISRKIIQNKKGGMEKNIKLYGTLYTPGLQGCQRHRNEPDEGKDARKYY